MTARKDVILQAALDYASRGWRVVPLFGVKANGKCECGNIEDSHARSAGKHPRLKEWQNQATTDEDTIQAWFSRWPNSNVGVHMGESSGLVDVESDDDEGEQNFLRLYDGNVPIVPTFQSARGKHRLFRWRPGLPNPDKAGFKIGTLEIQTGNDHGKQSVFPPSVRGDVEYKWLIHPDECNLGEFTDELLVRMENLFGEAMPKERRPKSGRHKLYEQDEVPEGQRDDTIYKEACHQWGLYGRTRGHKAFTDPDCQVHIFETMRAWNLMKCRPPLSDDEIHKKVESARQFMQKQISDEVQETDGRKLAMHGLEWRDGEWWPGSWKLTVLMTEPAHYYLHVPAWDDLIPNEQKQIHFTNLQFRDASHVAQAIFDATKTIIVDDRPGAWTALWNGTAGSKKDKTPGTRGLKAKLVESARLEEGSAEYRKHAMLAEQLAEKLGKFVEGDEPNKGGKPVKMPDGCIWVRWTKLWENEINLRLVTTSELLALSRAIGLGPKHSRVYPTSGAGRVRYVTLTPAHMEKLERLTEIPAAPPPEKPSTTPPPEKPNQRNSNSAA